MSARHLARLRQADGPADDPAVDGSEGRGSSGSDTEDSGAEVRTNAFNLAFGDTSPDEGASDSDEPAAEAAPAAVDADADADDTAVAPPPAHEAPAATASPTKKGNNTNNNNNKKKKKKKKKKRGTHGGDRGGRTGSARAGAGVDDHDALLADYMKELGDPIPRATADPLLKVDPRWVNYSSEWTKLFGKEVIAAAGAGGAPRGGRRGRGGRGGRASGTAALRPRRWMLWTPGPDLPPPPSRNAGGISMRLLATEGDVQHFTYEWSPEYQAAQDAYKACVATYDISNLMQLLQRQPFHIDTLLQLSEYYRSTRQVEAATDLLHRSLYTLEAAFHPSFKPWERPCRLNHAFAANTGLYTALFRHAKTVSKAGCHRAAFEVCKLMLQLSPATDPMRVRCCIDYYGCQARRYRQVARLAVSAGLGAAGCLLPNQAYSRAFALFHLETDGSSTALGPAAGAGASSGVGAGAGARAAGDSDDDTTPTDDTDDNATVAMVRALLLFPQCVAPLLSAVGVTSITSGVPSTGAAPSVPSSHCNWGVVLDHPLFAAVEFDSDILERLVSVFVTRQASVWKQPATLVWLYGCAVAVCSAFDTWSREPPSGAVSFTLTPRVAVAASAVMKPMELADAALVVWPDDAAVSRDVTALASLRAAVFATSCDDVTAALHLPDWLGGGRPLQSAVTVGSARSALAHYYGLVVSDFSDEVTTMAAEDLGEWMREDGMDVGGDGVGGDDGGAVLGRVDELNPDQNLLMLFLNSMLPWNVAAGGGGAGGGAGAGAGAGDAVE